ncbi:tripartite tricarboxylate transporter substrate binding protein [Pseudoroseomonas aestuarii]|uniref:tripartite tricarboxylate transporter substrate binding protein n=1 Tax=Teichococcus aestuarii TaxID=568898 RepID=UPI00360B3165
MVGAGGHERTAWPARGAGPGGGAALARPAPLRAALPERPIRLVVPWLPGGTADSHFRLLAELASQRLGRTVLVENKPGASGTLGGQMMANEAQGDGTLIGQIPVTLFRYPAMTKRPTFDPLKDFTYIIHLTGYLFGVVSRPDAPWRDWAGLIDHARRNPGRVTYGTPGVGSSLHITMERIGELAGVQWVHVPFRGGPDNIQAALSGQTHLAADSSSWAPLVLEGRMRLLCTWGAERAKRFPETPTLRDLGLDIVSDSPYGIGGPRGIPAATVRVLHDAFKDALHDPRSVTALERFDMALRYMDSETYAAFARRLYAEESATVRRLGLQID